jgi:hypothetical protein
MTDKELEDMLAIQQMPDAGPWQGTKCPCCGCLVEMRQSGLRSVALTGDKTLARYEYRASDLPDALWKALNRLLRECQWSRERNGFFVESRSADDVGIAHMLLLAEESHAKYVHDHGQ